MAIDWEAETSGDWVAISPLWGTLAAGESTTVALLRDEAPASTTYDVYFSETGTSPALIAENLTAPTATPPAPLNGGTNHTWQVMAKNASGSTPSPLWGFRTVDVETSYARQH